MVAGRSLRLEVLAPCRVHYSLDGWQTTLDLEASDTELGVWVADIRVRRSSSRTVRSMRPSTGRTSASREGRNVRISVVAG